MFKVLVLQALYNLSDHQAEFQIQDRLSFMRFVGLGLADKVPDAKTIWLFREHLVEAGAIQNLFARFDKHLAKAGYLAMGGQIVDATIVAAPKQRNAEDEKAAIKAGEVPEAWKDKPAKLRQKDRDARWTVKFSKAKPAAEGKPQHTDIAVPAFGNKNHVSIDRRHGFIRGWSATSAAAWDGAQLPDVLDRQNTGSKVWADTAYRSRKNENWLECNGFKSDIHRIEAANGNDPVNRFPAERRRADRSASEPPALMAGAQQSARRSSTSLPVRKGRWARSSGPSASCAQRRRSA